MALGAWQIGLAALGCFAVICNHDWWQDPEAQRRKLGPTKAVRELRAAGNHPGRNRQARHG